MREREPTAEQWYFEDIEIGESFDIPSKTMTDTHFVLFSGLTGDHHPIHMDEHYAAEETDFESRVAHGTMISMFTVTGASSLSEHLHESSIAFLEHTNRFVAPVFEGDTIYPTLTVADTEDKGEKGLVVLESEVFNQDDELVLEGELKLLVKAREGDE
ncbi:MaoC family dehydratase [Halovivax limisalsi]|uniref:MaoC family dehydratase n=1 Tax=Halovivax limisalsi TaxID=1453760 RepID=UPI001FFCBD4D|nr:MaoC/PaaZ C-terminal domain-containing protein [Halovivax limisalsi]